MALSDWYKQNETDLIWWRDDLESIGKFLFSFDKKRLFDFWLDFPQELTPEQNDIFKRENPILAQLKGV